MQIFQTEEVNKWLKLKFSPNSLSAKLRPPSKKLARAHLGESWPSSKKWKMVWFGRRWVRVLVWVLSLAFKQTSPVGLARMKSRNEKVGPKSTSEKWRDLWTKLGCFSPTSSVKPVGEQACQTSQQAAQRNAKLPRDWELLRPTSSPHQHLHPFLRLLPLLSSFSSIGQAKLTLGSTLSFRQHQLWHQWKSRLFSFQLESTGNYLETPLETKLNLVRPFLNREWERECDLDRDQDWMLA